MQLALGDRLGDGVGDLDRVVSSGDRPARARVVPAGECLERQDDFKFAGLSRIQIDGTEPDEPGVVLTRTAAVALHDMAAGPVAGVPDGDGREGTVGGGRHLWVFDSEGGVGQSVPEAEPRG